MNAEFDVTDVRLLTPRLVLRAWEESDLDDFYAYASVDGVGQMAGWVPHENKEKSFAILQHFISEKKTFALVDRVTDRAIGSLGIEMLRDRSLIDDPRRGREIGYVLAKDMWGQGLMPEAVTAVIHYCFDVLGYDFLTCGHFDHNHQSRRVIEKCGFTFYCESVYHTKFGTTERCLDYILFR